VETPTDPVKIVVSAESVIANFPAVPVPDAATDNGTPNRVNIAPVREYDGFGKMMVAKRASADVKIFSFPYDDPASTAVKTPWAKVALTAVP
jgi:hypothetical protein